MKLAKLWLCMLFLFFMLTCPLGVATALDAWPEGFSNPQQIEGTNYYIFGRYDVINAKGETFYALGVADQNANIVLEPEFFSISLEAPDGRRLVTDLDGKSGYLDPAFATAIPLEFDVAFNFKDGTALVGRSRGDNTYRMFLIDVAGNETNQIPPSYLEDEFYYTEIISYELNVLPLDNFENHLIIFKSDGLNSGHYGLVDLYSMEVLLETVYDSMAFSPDGRLFAGTKTGENQYKYTVFDSALNIQNTFSLGRIAQVDSEGFIFFFKDMVKITSYDEQGQPLTQTPYSLAGLADGDGNIIIEAELESDVKGLTFHDNLYWIAQKGSDTFNYVKSIGTVGNGKFGCVTKSGEEIIPFIYDDLSYDGNHQFTAVSGAQELKIDVSSAIKEPSYSEWAKESIEKAADLGLIPRELEGFYQNEITRKEFCHLAMRLYTAITGLDIDEILENSDGRISFTDTNDPYILAAYQLSIVSGTGDGRFSPESNITRAQAAVLLDKLSQALQAPYEPAENDVEYSDMPDIADWALESVLKMSGMKTQSGTAILNGVGGNRFNPLGTYTRQESIATMLRLYEAVTIA